jgi:hypothetical protein
MTQTAYQAHMQRRLYIRAAVTDLRQQGTPLPEVVEAVRNELQLLTIELEKAERAEASTKSLSRSGADSLPTDQTERQEINQSWQN